MLISTRKNDALLMLCPTERVELLAANAQIDAHLKHQKGISRPRTVEKQKNKTPENGLFKPFSGVFLMAFHATFDTIFIAVDERQ